jgi:hypothetical protein
MSITSQAFVAGLPSTEEEMLAICREVASQNNSVEHFNNTIEILGQLVEVMQDYLQRHTKKKG